mgnify:FL=1|tara:strand:+ start:1154 stop:1963 length:810 start_codon:yes stop_codon:yes gene_type:complete
MSQTKLIAEIGANHMGDMGLAEEMIAAAKESGADLVKFQTWSVDRLKPGVWDSDGRRQIYEKAELTVDRHFRLREYCDQIGISFFSSVFSVEDARILSVVERDIVKIPSMESRNKELIDYCGQYFDKVMVSTGTSTLEEIVESCSGVPRDKLVLLHCVSSYPCDFESVNLPRLQAFGRKYSDHIGFSDHSMGIEASVLALRYDLDYIEKHFTTDNNLPGRDNRFAILPDQMKRLKEFIDINEKVLIDKGTDYQSCEKDSRENYTGRWDG